MKYAVLSPDHMLICFDHSDQVTEYCLEIDNASLNEYCMQQGYVYETMSPTEIGQLYTEIGAVWGGCQIYETSDILQTMKENGSEARYIHEANELFNNRNLHNEIHCPGFIEDILGELTPIPVNELSDGIYFMENIDAPNDEKDNG